MADAISIVMKLNEDISSGMRSITNASKSVSKAFEDQQRQAAQLAQRYELFNKRAADTGAEAIAVRRAMQDAAAAFKQTGDEADRVRFSQLKSEFDALTDSQKSYSQQAKLTMRDIEAVHQTMRKQSAPGDLFSSWGRDLSTGLKASGFLKEFGGSLTNAASTMFESAVGQPLATLAESAFSSVFAGASAGAIAGPAGALAGGIGGLAAGVIGGETAIYEQKDEAFKSYYKGLYDTAAEETDASVASGRRWT